MHPGWFTPVMGGIGLALAWWRAAPTMGMPAWWIGVVVGLLATLVFVTVAAISLWRVLKHPAQWRADLAHPVRHAFVAAIPVSMILVSTWLQALAALLGRGALTVDGQTVALSAHWASSLTRLADGLWMLGAVTQLAVSAWVLHRWWRQGMPLAGVTPVHLIPVVGHVLTPLAGIRLGHHDWALAQFALGTVLWMMWATLLWQRRRRGPPLPAPLAPARFIQVAPLAVIGLSMAELGWGSVGPWVAWLMATVLVLWLTMQLLPQLKTMPFGLSHWALSFPLAAWASLSWMLGHELSSRTGVAGAALLPTALLAGVTLVLAGLSSATIKGLRRQELLTPEPDPTPQAPTSSKS